MSRTLFEVSHLEKISVFQGYSFILSEQCISNSGILVGYPLF